MEKNVYETYEYMPANNIDAEHDQFFVVQNDGTLLINRQVQYITQVQGVKGVLENVQPCTVYDVPSQQYYVDVENSAELISVTDQFTLPQEAGSNVFHAHSNYLLQPITDSSMISQNAVSNEMEPVNADLDMDIGGASEVPVTENTNLTAVTLTDNQYNILEEKGWVILNINDKVVLLNALGLHDITGNIKLIQQLKIDCEPCEEVPTTTKAIKDVNIECPLGKMEIEKVAHEEGTVKLEFHENYVSSSVDNVPKDSEEAKPSPVQESIAAPANLENKDETKPKGPANKNCTVVRLNTNLCLKDIPKQIVLGKTVNGKKMVAKVIEVKRVSAASSVANQQERGGHRYSSTTNEMDPAYVTTENETYKSIPDVENLIQCGLISDLTCTAEDVSGAEMIIKQLMNVPTTRAPMIGRNLIITKVVKQVNDDLHTITEFEPTIVTGRVAQLEETRDWQFIYIPYLLRKLASKSNFETVDESNKSASSSPLRKIDKVREDYLLHVHVVETRNNKHPTKTSISFLKRRPPKKNEAWACSACAKLFNTEKQLKVHQEAQCLDPEDDKPPLIIDTDKFNKQNVNKSHFLKGIKKNTCLYCNAKVKYSNYKRHLQSHFGLSGPSVKNQEPEDQNNKNNKALYKCKMCSCSYIHASSLSKHIMAQHIKLHVLQT